MLCLFYGALDKSFWPLNKNHSLYAHKFILDFARRNLNLVELFVCKTAQSLSCTGINLHVHIDSGSSHLKNKNKKRSVLLFRVLYSHLLKVSETGRGHIHLEIILLATSAIKMKTSVIFLKFRSLLNSKTCSVDFAAET